MKRLSLISLTLSLVVGATMLFCINLPESPAGNPKYADITLSIDNVMLHRGDAPQIGVAVYFTQHFQTVTLRTSCNVFDTSFSTGSLEEYDTLYFSPLFDITGPCTVFVNAQFKDNGLRDKCDTLSLYIFPDETGIYFSTKQPSIKTVTGKTDTLLFVTGVSSGTVLPPEYTITAVPSEGITITPHYSQKMDTIRIITLASVSDTFTVKVLASALYGGSLVKDSVFTGIRVLSAGTLLIDTADTVLKAVTTLFNKNETILTAIEGKQLKHDLRPYFIKPQTGSVLFSADSGAIKDTVWEWTPPYGSKDTVLVTISATNDTIVSQLKCTLLITPSDTTRPELSIIDTSLNGKKVSSPQITVQAIAKDSEAGIDSVIITCGTVTTPAVLQQDSTYSGVVSGLQNGIPTEITITAVDKSMKKNTTALKFTVTFDSTADGVAPAITTTLPATVKVTEGETLSLNVVASGSPAPTYQWYKGNEVLENQISPEFSKSNVTADDSGSYHVVVSNGIGTPVISTKTAVSIRFKAKITQQPVAASIKEGGNGSFTVKARGEVPLTYQWYKNGELITEAASSEYSITNADTTDNGKRFTCVVSNAINNDTSTAGVLTVIKKPVYQVSFETGEDAIAPAIQHIAEGGKIVQPADPTRNGYDFSGWYKDAATTNRWNFESDVVNGPVTLYAKWIEKRYTVTYYANGGTSGSEPEDSKTYTTGEVATILPNTGKLLKGDQSFCGWNTKEDGTGTNKSCGGLITITASVTLYAKYSTDEVMDNDGNTYGVTTIGGVTWMRQNLRTTKYNNGDPILQVTGEAAWQNLLGGAYCWPENNENNKEYGALYNWFAVNTGNLAPPGWHVATQNDWQIFHNSLGDSAHCKLIDKWSTYWTNPPECGTDYYVFTANANGCRECQGTFGIFTELPVNAGFVGINEGATWWTSTDYFVPNSAAYFYYLHPTGLSGLIFIDYVKGLGVRCVKDE